MESEKLAILHEHYRDSCSLMQKQRAARDRNFYLVVALVAVVWFDVVAPKDFATIAADSLKAKLHLTAAPDLGYLRSVLWFILLGLTVRYCQTALSVERSYDYIHEIEALLAKHVDPVFGREGKAYLTNYPLFSHWAHVLYVLVSPALLMAVVIAWTCSQLPFWWPWTWPGVVWFQTTVSVAIVVSIALYWAFHFGKRNRKGQDDDK